MLRGQLFLHQKKAEQARDVLEISEALFKADGRSVEYAKSQLLLAAAYSQEEKQDDARYKLKELLESDNHTRVSSTRFLSTG